MIVFYGTTGCRECDAIEEALQTLCLAHERVLVAPHGGKTQRLPRGIAPPALVDGKEIIEGHGAVLVHLEKLAEIKGLWDKYQSDACYCDDEGNAE